jgi:hypothetical protein
MGPLGYPKFLTDVSGQPVRPFDGTGRLSRNVGNKLPLLAAQQPRRAQLSSTSRRKPDITGMSYDFATGLNDNYGHLTH